MDQRDYFTITTAAEAIRRGDLTAEALVEQSLRAIDAHNAETNAFIRIDAASAREDARARDLELKRGTDRGPLHGIPISLKDLIDAAGTPTTGASKAFLDRVAPRDAEIVTRLRNAGAIFLGKTNLHEVALGTTSDDSAFGPVRHPADRSRVAGGSSGGSAVAVATGMGLASIGSDTGGSIRIPAACCGVVGLKPSLADVPTDGVMPLSKSLDHVGPLARTVADAALVWAILAGRPPVSPKALPARGLRLKRLTGYFLMPLAPEVREAFDRALSQLTAAGVAVADGVLPDTSRIVTTYVNIVLPEGAWWHKQWLDTRGEAYSPTVRSRLESGRTISAVDYLDARATQAELSRAVVDALADCDALVLPTLPIVAPLVGAGDIVIDPADPGPTPVRAAMLKHTQPFNLSGHPAISLPIRTTGLPVGLQLVGRLNDTARLLEIAAACESIVRLTAEPRA